MAEQTTLQKIVFVLHGGVNDEENKHLIMLANNIDRSLYEPMLITISEGGSLQNFVKDDVIFYNVNKSSMPSASLPLFQKLIEIKPNIVVSSKATVNFYLLSFGIFLRKTKFVIRESISPHYLLKKNKKTSLLLRAGYTVLYPTADLVICSYQKIIQDFDHRLKIWLPQMKILFPSINRIQTQNNGQSSSDNSLEHGDAIHFVCKGRLEHKNGYDRLVKLFSKLVPEFQWHLTILGRGPQKEKLIGLINDHGLSDKIDIIENTEEPWPYIERAAALLLPSRYDGLPQAALESLACGTPVIASSDVEGAQELFSLSSEGAVTICNGMKEFMTAVTDKQHAQITNERPSLLPASFEQDAIIARFQKLLEENI